jgi:hypothetical protein
MFLLISQTALGRGKEMHIFGLSMILDGATENVFQFKMLLK